MNSKWNNPCYPTGLKFPIQSFIKDISRSDEAALETLMENNPSLMTKIHQYFSGVPQVVLLPNLQWDFDLYPDFNEDGFYLNYDHILTAHPPLRDRMLYGLKRLAYLINLGVSNEESYFIKCENFENLMENVYNCKLISFNVRSFEIYDQYLFSNLGRCNRY